MKNDIMIFYVYFVHSKEFCVIRCCPKMTFLKPSLVLLSSIMDEFTAIYFFKYSCLVSENLMSENLTDSHKTKKASFSLSPSIIHLPS